jgi:hypothetical protein
MNSLIQSPSPDHIASTTIGSPMKMRAATGQLRNQFAGAKEIPRAASSGKFVAATPITVV